MFRELHQDIESFLLGRTIQVSTPAKSWWPRIRRSCKIYGNQSINFPSSAMKTGWPRRIKRILKMTSYCSIHREPAFASECVLTRASRRVLNVEWREWNRATKVLASQLFWLSSKMVGEWVTIDSFTAFTSTVRWDKIEFNEWPISSNFFL